MKCGAHQAWAPESEIPYQPPVEEAPIPVLRSPLVDALRKPGIGGIRVLVVDDHEVVRQGIRGMLERTDMVVVGEAGDGETAIKQLQALEPDVVLMDIQMPTLDGVEAMRRMQELGLNTPVILLSVYAKDEYIFEGLRAGARGYLLKDVDRDELVQAIRSVHAGSSLFQPLIASRLVQRLSGEEAVGLTEREIEVLRALGAGGRDKEIADQLFLSFSTVRFHISNIYRKLGVQSRTEALLVATERGLLNT